MWTHLWLFIFLKRKQIPNSWIFCIQYKVFVTLLNNHRFLFCWLVSRSRKYWDFANDVSGADRINLSYTGSWNTSTLFNKRKQVDKFYSQSCLSPYGIGCTNVALSAVFPPLLHDFQFIIHLQQLLRNCVKLDVLMHWKENNFILKNSNQLLFRCN